MKTHLIGLSHEELTGLVASFGMKPFRAQQLWCWMYQKGITDFDAMTNIGKPERDLLKTHCTLERPGISKDLTSTDTTRKWLLKFADGNEIETVFIPEEDRGALCVSSQVGCTLTCSFCHTGTQKLVRNLTAGEIVAQVLTARDGLDEWNKKRNQCLFTNIVMMGMGEPLFNYDQVAKALTIIMDGEGIAISKRKITLSTSGVIPMIERCGEELNTNLAISLHAVRDDVRDILVPLNKKYPIKELLAACKRYPGMSNARRITFEYVMLKGVNDSDADAHELARLLDGIYAKVNIIPFNPWPGAIYECSSNNRIHRFADILHEHNLVGTIRTPRGRDIFAACGQLKSESERKKGEKVALHH